jgi:hypothetical protein
VYLTASVLAGLANAGASMRGGRGEGQATAPAPAARALVQTFLRRPRPHSADATQRVAEFGLAKLREWERWTGLRDVVQIIDVGLGSAG